MKKLKLINAVLETLYEIEIKEINSIISEAEEQMAISDETKKQVQDIGLTFGRGYAKWLMIKIISKQLKQEDVYKYKDYFKYFEKGKKLNLFTYNDIFKYKDLNQFVQEAIKAHEKLIGFQGREYAEDPKYLVSPQQIQNLENVGIKFLGVTSEGYQCFMIPKNLKGDTKAFETQRNILGRCQGREMRAEISICTMANIEYFNDYLSSDNLFVFFNMKDPNSPYQIHFKSNSYLNKNDAQIDETKLKSFMNFMDSIKKLPLNVKIFNLFDKLTPEEIDYILSSENDLREAYLSRKISKDFNKLTSREIKIIFSNKAFKEGYLLHKITNHFDQLTSDEINEIYSLEDNPYSSGFRIRNQYWRYKINNYFNELTPEEIKYLLSSDDGILYVKKKINKYLDQLTPEEIQYVLFFKPSYITTQVELSSARANYFNMLRGESKFISIYEFNKNTNLGIAYTEERRKNFKNYKHIFINTNGENDVTGLNIDELKLGDRAYYLNTISPIKFVTVNDFDVNFPGLATASLTDNYRADVFVNRKGELDTTGINFDNCPSELKSTYFNTKFRVLIYDRVYDDRMYAPGIYLASGNYSNNYFINKDGKPDVTGIDFDKLNYNEQKIYNKTQIAKVPDENNKTPYYMSYINIV